MNLSLNINSLSKNYYVSEDDKIIEDGIAEGWYTTCLKKTAIWIELLTNTFLLPFLLFQLFVGLSFYVPFQNSKTCSIKMCDSFCSIDNRSTTVLCFHLHQLERCVSNFWNSVYKTVDINISVLCFLLGVTSVLHIQMKSSFSSGKNSAKTWYFNEMKSFWKLMIWFCYFYKKNAFCFGLGPWGPPFCKSWPQKW